MKKKMMKKFKVPVEYRFVGNFEIMADDADQASKMVEESCGLVLDGRVRTSLPDKHNVDWECPVHTDKIVGKAIKV